MERTTPNPRSAIAASVGAAAKPRPTPVQPALDPRLNKGDDKQPYSDLQDRNPRAV